ncbi:MAG: glycosyltransferase family 2 protein [Candidatus Jordarchaeum sp.]|uniref:glycosyltransferase family 2 protein n=1 Tax=Candidatus Jordarchaeum sp. TaxID=2823881 RepID=UPI004049AB71
MKKHRITVLIPCYNEEGSILEVIDMVKKVDLSYPKEIIVVDDGSEDNSVEKVKTQTGVRLLQHEKNQGKGKAIQTGLQNATGDIIVIQDADLEYFPKDIPLILEPLIEGKAGVVFGSRFLGKADGMSISHSFGNKVLSWATRVLYGNSITDMMTGYKAFFKGDLEGVTLKSKGFEFEPEIVTKLLKKGKKIMEVPISYSYRRKGKAKIGWKDGVICLWWLIKGKFSK